jgi:hypothetical protein
VIMINKATLHSPHQNESAVGTFLDVSVTPRQVFLSELITTRTMQPTLKLATLALALNAAHGFLPAAPLSGLTLGSSATIMKSDSAVAPLAKAVCGILAGAALLFGAGDVALADGSTKTFALPPVNTAQKDRYRLTAANALVANAALI